MKKIAPIAVSAVAITIPVVASGVIDLGLHQSSMLTLPSNAHSFHMNLISAEIDKEPEGVIGNVTYYGKRNGRKEVLDILLDSQTVDKDDKCFLKVIVFSSDGDIEYQSDTMIIYFKAFKHYEIELEPPKKENEIYREVRVAATFYSNDTDMHQYINFNINYEPSTSLTFEENLEYTSNYPIAVWHNQAGSSLEYYETLGFNNICNLSFKKPIFDINKMNFTYKYKNYHNYLPNYDECYLLIEGIYDNSDMEEENGMKKIPLNLNSKNGIVYFELVNDYYYDSSDGMLYQNDKSGRNQVSTLLLPSTFAANNEAVYYELHFTNFCSRGDEVVFKSYATFEIKWFGLCGESYFCVKSIDELLENVYYSGGIIV